MSILAGKWLRARVREYLESKGAMSARELTRRIGRKNNFVTSYLRKEPEEWALPKHDALVRLLAEIGVSDEEFHEAVRSESSSHEPAG